MDCLYASDMEHQRLISLGSLTQVLVLLALIPATMYPLGLLILALQLGHTYSQSISTAFGSALLVSKPEVLVVGVDSIFASIVATPLGVVTAALVALDAIFVLGMLELRNRRFRALRPPYSSISYGEVASSVQTRRRYEMISASIPRSIRDLGRHRLSVFALYIIFMIVGELYIAFTKRDHLTMEYVSQLILIPPYFMFLVTTHVLLMIRRLKNKLVGVLCLVIFGFVAVTAILQAAPLSPDLSRVIVDRPDGSAAAGRLLAHSDGYWYVFNSDGDLNAIRDDSVEHVTILGR